jgi:streptogramin lyase
VQVNYDGLGSPGYYVTVTLSANAATSETATISPLIVSSTSTSYTQASSSLGLTGNGDLVPFAVSEANAPTTPTFTFTRGVHCPAVALLETLSSSTFNVLALGNASTYSAGTGCTISVSDGTSTVTLAVSNTYGSTPGTHAFTEFSIPTTPAYPTAVTVGSDGAMWFTQANDGYIGRIPVTATSGSQISQHILPAGSTLEVSAATVGPDGNVWYSNCDGSVGKVTPAGAATVYPLPDGGIASGVTAGPDGNMWFTECVGLNVDRVTTSGTITSLPVSTPALGITEGPDGNIWEAQYMVNAIARVTPTGAVTAFTLPTASAEPFAITAGPDGNLWFIERQANKIGRITPAGVITEFTIPTPNATPVGIITGADGALWFTEQGGNKIGRITTNGAITEYSVPTPASAPGGIASGPDGAIWFTENSGNNIGRLVI